MTKSDIRIFSGSILTLSFATTITKCMVSGAKRYGEAGSFSLSSVSPAISGISIIILNSLFMLRKMAAAVGATALVGYAFTNCSKATAIESITSILPLATARKKSKRGISSTSSAYKLLARLAFSSTLKYSWLW